MNIIPCVCAVAQLCLTLCDSMDWSLSGFSINGMGLSQQEYWSGLPFPPPGDLPNPGIEPAFPALAEGFLTTAPPLIQSSQKHFEIDTFISPIVYSWGTEA